MTSTAPPLGITEESQVAWSCLGRSNVLVTGRAGTGKSTLLEEFYDNTPLNTVKLAPTGVAALNIGGSTIHSFFGFKQGIQPREAALMRPKNAGVYGSLDCLIIDEVSMLRPDLLDCIDAFLQVWGRTQVSLSAVWRLPCSVTPTSYHR